MLDAAAASVRTGPGLPTDLFQPVRHGLEAVDAFIERELGTHGAALGEMGRYLLVGGKRLRPALVLLVGGLFGADPERLVPVAAACEVIHTATLIHDDVIDRSDTRRGLPTLHRKWGASASVLVGDHLFAKGFSILAAQGDPVIVGIMSEVVSQTCAGEIDQLQVQWDLDTTEEDYLRRIYAKTGHFIAACCRMGAVLGGATPEALEAVSAYGTHVGTCFQLVDDLLDFTADERVLGKPTGSDLRTGVYTLPVVRALAGPRGPELRRILRQRPVDDGVVARVRELLASTGALESATATAVDLARRAQAALASLPPGVYRDHLHALAEELAHRVS